MARPKRSKTGGRAKGTPNRVTVSVKAALLEAFDRRGGVDALLRWSDECPSEFYALWGRLIPREAPHDPALAVVRVPYGEHMEFVGSLTGGGVLLPRLRAQAPPEAIPEVCPSTSSVTAAAP
jgi:hypothetical protein